MKDPAFLFYYQDFLVGTSFMSNEEVGAYIRVLCHLADKDRISEEDMLKICERYDLVKIVQKKLMVDDEGYYFNLRLRQEIEKRRKYAESRRNNRKSKNISKTYLKDMNNISKTYVKHMENENENIYIYKGGVGGKDFDMFWLQKFDEKTLPIWNDYLNHLIENGIKFTRTNIRMHVDKFKECEKAGIEPKELLDAFITSNHKGIYWVAESLLKNQTGGDRKPKLESMGKCEICGKKATMESDGIKACSYDHILEIKKKRVRS